MKELHYFFIFYFLFVGCKNPIQEVHENDIIHPSSMNPEIALDLDYYTGRLGWQKPYYVISLLGDLSEKTVADIGAGVGFFAFRLSEKAEKVIAIDIDPQIIEILEVFKLNLPPEKRKNFETRLVTADDPQLTENEVDAIIIINTIAFIDNRLSYLRKLKKAIKPGGKLLISDFKMKRFPENIDAPPFKYRVHMHEIENDLLEAGFMNLTTDDTSLDYQFIVIGIDED